MSWVMSNAMTKQEKAAIQKMIDALRLYADEGEWCGAPEKTMDKLTEQKSWFMSGTPHGYEPAQEALKTAREAGIDP